MTKLLHFPGDLYEKDQYGFFDDFLYYIDADLWTELSADTTATVAIDADGEGGIVQLTTDATNNNEVALATTNELFIFAANRPIVGIGRIQYAESATDDANVMFGFMDAIGADAMVDDGVGPKTTFDGAVIYKLDGGTVWRCRSSNGTANTDTVSTTTAGGTDYQELRIEVHEEGSTGNVIVTYFVDGVHLKDSNGNPIRHVVSTTSATQMDFGVYAKAGSASSEVVSVDYLGAWQRRA